MGVACPISQMIQLELLSTEARLRIYGELTSQWVTCGHQRTYEPQYI